MDMKKEKTCILYFSNQLLQDVLCGEDQQAERRDRKDERKEELIS